MAKLNCVLYKHRLRGDVGKVFWYPNEMLLVGTEKGELKHG
jgi:hypothetical protein